MTTPRVHTLLAYAAGAAWILCLAFAIAAADRARQRRPGLFQSQPPADDSPATTLTLGAIARRAGAIGILLMLASKCAGSY